MNKVHQTHEVFLALGSNLGDRKTYLNKAIQLIEGSFQHVRIAPFIETKPVGVTDQPDFLNTVLVGFTELKPLELLDFVKGIENKVGRQATYRWGPREIDIDIIFYDDLVLQTEVLEIPHPRMQERRFVLEPLMKLEPEFVHPKLCTSIKNLYTKI